MKNIKIVGVVVVLIIIALVIWFIKGSSSQQVSKLDATDTVVSYYGGWLTAVKEPVSASPSKSELANSPILSKALRAHLKESLKQSDQTLDPVLCQSVVPDQISTRTVLEDAGNAQILVTSKDKKVTEQAVINLIKLKEGWYIDSIECSPGEFGIKKEFSFEMEGFLLKDSIPAPYDPKNWHLVYEENGQAGNVIPIFFGTQSQCADLSGNKSVCKPDQFKDGTKVSVHGQMTEYGVNVDKQELVK